MRRIHGQAGREAAGSRSLPDGRSAIRTSHEPHLRPGQPLSDTFAMAPRGRAIDKHRTKMTEDARWFASQGGKARANALTAKERRAIGKKGAGAR